MECVADILLNSIYSSSMSEGQIFEAYIHRVPVQLNLFWCLIDGRQIQLSRWESLLICRKPVIKVLSGSKHEGWIGILLNWLLIAKCSSKLTSHRLPGFQTGSSPSSKESLTTSVFPTILLLLAAWLKDHLSRFLLTKSHNGLTWVQVLRGSLYHV